MTNQIDALVARRPAFQPLPELCAPAPSYRPSCDVSDPETLAIADAYDARAEMFGDPRRAYRYGTPYTPELTRKPVGRVWANQAKRTASVVATTDTAALLVYDMPNGRSYFWEVPIDTTWRQLQLDAGNETRPKIRNIGQTRPPKRWAAAIAKELGI